MRFILFSLFFIICFCQLSCRKDVEAPAGDAGGKGKNSTPVATVFTVDTTAWQLNSDLVTWSATVENQQITSAIVQYGIVKIYMLRSTSWWELPYTENREALTRFGIETGKIHLFRSESHGPAERPQKLTLKLVVTETEPL